jgi:hypothetical protein
MATIVVAGGVSAGLFVAEVIAMEANVYDVVVVGGGADTHGSPASKPGMASCASGVRRASGRVLAALPDGTVKT